MSKKNDNYTLWTWHWDKDNVFIPTYVGLKGYEEIKRFCQHLTGLVPDHTEYSCSHRQAPSVIVRGEAEMLGISEPRFSYRVRLARKNNGPVEGFINLRCLGQVTDTLEYTGRVALGSLSPFWREWKKQLKFAPVIADAILAVPPRIGGRSGWFMVLMPKEVVRDYGEGEAGSFRAVPFLKHISIVGGGLCAQASCWMATMFLYNHAKRVPTIPEITYIAQCKPPKSFRLNGLSPIEIINYFNDRSTGLTASLQRSHFVDLPEQLTTRHLYRLTICLHSYIKSGFPVLMGVDLDRMSGRFSEKQRGFKNIYAQNKINVPTDVKPDTIPRDRRHMIVIFGVDSTKNTFLFNDPSHFPFLEASLFDLLEARCYRHPPLNNTTQFRLGDKLELPSFYFIVPSAVKLSLLCQVSYHKGVVIDGLVNISEALHYNNTGQKDGSFLQQLCHGYHLCPLGSAHSHFTDYDQQRNTQSLSQLTNIFTGILAKWPSDHWIWLEERKGIIRIWDAELSPDNWDGTVTSASSFLIGTIIQKCGSLFFESGSAVFHHVPRYIDNDISLPLTTVSNLHVSIISSFSNRNETSVNNLITWNNSSDIKPQKIDLNLYFFMRQDGTVVARFEPILPDFSLRHFSKYQWIFRNARYFRRLLVRKIEEKLKSALNYQKWANAKYSPVCAPEITVCEWLASRFDDDKYITRVADRLLTVIKELRIGGITTFFPEVVSKPNYAIKAINAFKFIGRLLGIVQSKTGDIANPLVVEAVAGSIIEDISIVKGSRKSNIGVKQEYFQANTIGRSECYNRLIKALKAIIPCMPLNALIALELEPGDLYVLSNQEHLLEFNTHLNDDDVLCYKVGYNLDIAHWNLADIPVTFLAKSGRDLRRRIIHSHWCDSGLGHFGDLPVHTTRDREHFLKWLTVIQDAYSVTDSLLKHTDDKYACVEIEHPMSAAIAKAALERVVKLL